MLVDTDILIWSLRGNESAINYIDSLEEMYISDISYMELLQGSRNKKELLDIQKTLDHIGVEKISVTESISKRAIGLMEKYTHSHSMQLADALIAATAIIHNLRLSSGNKKHFEYLPNLNFTAFQVKVK